MAHLRSWTKVVLGGLMVLLSLVVACNFWIVAHTQGNIYSDIQQVRAQVYGLVLGTNPKQLDGTANEFFKQRMNCAALLYKHGKVRYLVLSGGKEGKDYNEPIAMQKALVKLGVPVEATILDTKGNNTLASFKQVKQIIGNHPLIIITQRFHGYRALYISRCCGIKALVCAAKMPYVFDRTLLRECLAGVKALIDLHVLQKHRHPTVL